MTEISEENKRIRDALVAKYKGETEEQKLERLGKTIRMVNTRKMVAEFAKGAK